MDISFLLPTLVLSVGTYFLFKLRFFFILHPIKTVKRLVSSLRSPDIRRSLFLALAGTLGVGNVFGVAAGIIYGGAGSVLWLAVSALFASVIKYSECVTSFCALGDGSGGMHRVLMKSFPRVGTPLAILYTLLCLFLALFMGGAMQMSAFVGALGSLTQKAPILPVLIFSLFVLLGVAFGSEKIDRITEKIIPVTIIIYILLTLSVVFANISSLGNAFLKIIREAVTAKTAIGGVGAFFFSRAFSEGFARGILSNEAGCGTSSFAHTRSKERSPFLAGLSGMCEVHFDTVLCILTALAILCTVESPEDYTSPMLLVSDAIGSVLGDVGRGLLLFCVAAFAYSTVVCWYFYGTLCACFLSPRLCARAFVPIFFAFLIFGSSLFPRLLISFTDILLLALSVLTLSAIIHHKERIKDLTELML